MRECVILRNDKLVSLSHTTHSSSFNSQIPSPQSSSPICVRVLVRVVGTVGGLLKRSCLMSSYHRTSHSTCPWHLWQRICTWACWPLSKLYQWGCIGQDWLLKVVPTVRKLSPHWTQLSGDTQSVWKQQNTRGIGCVDVTSSQTRSVPWHHSRHWQNTDILLLKDLTTCESHHWL
jgi:hypothetical protein